MDDTKIEIVREICLETDFYYIKTLVEALTGYQLARLETIADGWDAIRFKTGDMIPNGSNEFFVAQEEKRRQRRHLVRTMLGLPAVSDTEIEIATLNGTYGSLSAAMGGGGSSGGSGEFGLVAGNGVGRGDSGSEL
jgi:hypothetical protein